MVLTTLRGTDAYPNTLQVFGYSGVYMPVQMENIARPIVQQTQNVGNYNK